MSAPNDSEHVRKRIKAIRAYMSERHGRSLTQGDMGTLLGVSPHAVPKWEQRGALPERVAMLKLYEEYKIDANFIIFGSLSGVPMSVAERLKSLLEEEEDFPHSTK